MSEGVCAFVIAITSVVQRRERERERLGGEGRGVKPTTVGTLWNKVVFFQG
jgi:hypothetical protein